LASAFLHTSLFPFASAARARHALPDRGNFLRRYLTELLFRGGDRARRGLNAHPGGGALFGHRPRSGIGFELGVDARLHGIDRTRAWAGVDRRDRPGKRDDAVK